MDHFRRFLYEVHGNTLSYGALACHWWGTHCSYVVYTCSAGVSDQFVWEWCVFDWLISPCKLLQTLYRPLVPELTSTTEKSTYKIHKNTHALVSNTWIHVLILDIPTYAHHHGHGYFFPWSPSVSWTCFWQMHIAMIMVTKIVRSSMMATAINALSDG